MSDMMSITDMLARLRADTASEQFEGARLGPIAVRELLRHVDSLVAEAAELRRERDELSEQAALTARHLAIISGVLGSPEPIEIDDIAARLHLLIAGRDELAARLAEIAAQEPVAWIERITGRLADPTDEHRTRFPMVYSPLIHHPAPAAAPERSWSVHLASQADLIDVPSLCNALSLLGISTPESQEDAGARVGELVNELVRGVMRLKRNYSEPPNGSAAAPAQAAPTDGCGACGDACRSRASCRLADESPKPAAKTCRCGPDGCPDRVSCPKGGAA